MSDNPIFQIGKQEAGRDIINIARDMNVTKNSSTEDILKIIKAMQHEVGELNIDEKHKRKINNRLEDVNAELEDKEPDKESIEESIKEVIEIFKKVKATGKKLKDVGMFVGKVAKWIGTTAEKLGWFL